MRVSDPSVEVTVVRWPAEAETRALLARDGRPRVLVVAAGLAAPPPLDDLEDWVNDPVDAAELLRRSDALRQRARQQRATPRLDEHGLLHFDGRWVAISDAQLPLVRLLVERFGQLVSTDELTEAYVAAGGTTNPSSIRTALMRVRNRVGAVGLRLDSARHRGVVLDTAGPARR